MPLPPRPPNARPAGHAWLANHFKTRSLPHHCQIYVSQLHTRSEITANGWTRRVLPVSQWPGDQVSDHLKFALKYEGLNLTLLREVLPATEKAHLAEAIRAEPLGANARRLWYLWEALTGGELDVPDLDRGNYVLLADPDTVYTGPRRNVPRQRIALNLLGDLDFCFVIRRTEALEAANARRFDLQCRELLSDFPPEIFERALDYLYRKETGSSFAIERETPDQRRADAFVRLLQEADHRDYFDRDALVALQNAIVDQRFANHGWRDSVTPPEQNFVSGRNAPNLEGIHFIPPRPEEIAGLMEGWLSASRLALESDVPPVIAAAAIAWSFVFLHPFTDGNGRIHRFLIHHVLARRGFAPKGIIFPVSAAMLDDPHAYDASLEAFSSSLLPLLDWTMDPDRRLRVHHDSSALYRAVDYTAMAEALYRFVERTVERDLPAERLEALQNKTPCRGFGKAYGCGGRGPGSRRAHCLSGRSVICFIANQHPPGGRRDALTLSFGKVASTIAAGESWSDHDQIGWQRHRAPRPPSRRSAAFQRAEARSF